MDNPLENFLKDLANKIQTAKEYKDIVQDSQTVDVNKNVFEGFITGIAETIKKELKERAVVVPVSASDITPEPKQQEDSFVKFVSTLANTISANKNKPSESIPIAQKPTEENEEKEKPDTQVKSEPVTEPEEDSFQKFLGNLKDIIKKEPAEKPKPVEKINKKQDKPKPVNQYVDELKKDKSEAEEKPLSKEDSIKKLVRQFVEKEIKNFKDEVGTKIGQMGSSYGGGGNNSYNYYPDGGPMYGNLSFPTSGTGIVFADGTTLTSTAGLTASGGGGGGGNPAVNALVISNSAYWNTAYTNLVNNSAAYLLSGTDVYLGDIPVLSSYWTAAYTNLVNNSAAYLSGTNLGDMPVLSANWNNTYTQYSTYSASYARTDQDVTFQNNVTILGNLTAKGTATFANTIFTTTSALSVINTGPGPALYVFQGAGPYDVASFYDGDGVEVLHVGNANPGGLGYVGINESFPGAELTVQGNISASRSITVAGGNSNQWNSSYSSVNSNSSIWNSVYSTTNTNSSFWNQAYTNLISNSSAYLSGVDISLLTVTSGSWNSVYTSVRNNSAFWNDVYNNVAVTSAARDSVYSTTRNNSAGWGSVYTSFNTNSARYDSSWTTVNSNSASWNSVYNNVNSASAAQNSVYTSFNNNSANYILDGGNTKSNNISIGTNNAYNLNLETNNTTRVTILSSGRVAIGTATPDQLPNPTDTLAVSGNMTLVGRLSTNNDIILGSSIIGTATQNVFNTGSTTINAFGAATTLNIGNWNTSSLIIGGPVVTAVSQTIDIGPASTQFGHTKTINIGTNATAGATVINIGSQFDTLGFGATNSTLVYGPLTVTRTINASGGNSNQWNSVYTTVSAFSASWGGGNVNLGQIPVLSANWNSTYTTVQNNSGSWAGVTKIIAGTNVTISPAGGTGEVTINSTGGGGGGGVGNVSSYVTTIGDGASSTYTVTHNLSTTGIIVQVHDTSTGEVIYPSIQASTVDTVVLDFDVVPSIDQYQVVVLASGAVGVSQIIAGSNITISPVSGTGIVTINASGGGGGETAAAIPAPVLKWDQIGSGVPPFPPLYVTYAPCLTSSWLSPQTEVWLFAYRINKRTNWGKKIDGINVWLKAKYVSGYVHPADTTRWAANSGKPVYAGDPGRIYHTEFSFTSAGQVPVPYQQVSLSAFNPLEFYKNKRDGTPQVSAIDFPFVYDSIPGEGYGLGLPRMSRDTIRGKNLKLYLAFRFAMPNPDTNSKFPKLFGPPAFLTVSPKLQDGSTFDQPGSSIVRMTYATKQSK